MPMGELIIDFYDKLKSLTRGYGTMSYEMKWYTPDTLVRLDIFVNAERVEAFSMIVHKDKAYQAGKDIVSKLKTLIPKHLFSIPLQAGIWVKMIARETISAIRKDVTAKCYGWDISRKKKLLKNQKEGKKKMKQMGRVSVPGDVFIKLVGR
jgi:GTP-binding protein LepA